MPNAAKKKWWGSSAVVLSLHTAMPPWPWEVPRRRRDFLCATCSQQLLSVTAWGWHGKEHERGRPSSLGKADINLWVLKVHRELNLSVKDYSCRHFKRVSLCSHYSALEQAGSPSGWPSSSPSALASMGIHRCYVRQRKAPLLFPTWNCSENILRIISIKKKGT